jgi:hypothetical protein
MNSDMRDDSAFLGRNSELYQLVRNLVRGRHTILVGPRGIGKSRVMLEAKAILDGSARNLDVVMGLNAGLNGASLRGGRTYRIIYIMHVAPLGDCLKEMCQMLHQMGKLDLDLSPEECLSWELARRKLRGKGSMDLQRIIITSIRQTGQSFLVFLDSLDRLAPSHHGFFETLLAVAVICAAVVHERESLHLKKVWSSFARIDIGPLSDATTRQLIRHYVETYAINVLDRELYEREIIKAAGGNPFHIKNMVWHGSRERRVTQDEIRQLRRIEEGDYFNMGPVYIFVASMFTMLKIFSLGTDNREFYLYFSALGFLVYMVFRVFRAFFLFRPQRVNR